MNTIRITAIFFILACSFLSGCTTVVWKESESGMFSVGKVITDKTKNSKLIKEDVLVGLVQVQSQDQKTKPQLMIIGEKYAYKIDSGAEEAFKVIQSTSERNYWRLKPSDECNCNLNIIVSENTQKNNILDFYGSINLYYLKPVMDSVEVDEMKRLGASIQDIPINKHFKKTMFVKKIHLRGQIVGLNKEFKNLKLQNFSQDYPIEMYSQRSTQKSVNFGILLKKIALTPFALIGDVVIVPFLLLTD